MIWKVHPTLEGINSFSRGNMTEHLGIEFTEIGDEYLVAKMPVDHRTTQPFGLLHGGASVVLAETIGSVASQLCIDNPLKQTAVGLEINANHIKSIKSGYVYGIVKPIKIGRTIHIWDILITNDKEEKVCISRLTTMIINVE